MPMTDVSYIVTVYNKAAFIPDVTRAIFAQKDLGPCEYIFVDDGSTDDSVDVLKACTAGRDNVKIITQANAGPALATNRGIDEAASPFLKFVDGDDILHPRATAELRKALDAHPDIDLAYTLGREVALDAEEMKAPDRPLSGRPVEVIDDPMARVVKKALFNLTCVLARTEAVRAMGGCDPRVFIQDYSFALRMAHRTKFALVPSELNWAPNDVANRASALSGGAQVLHDLNAALGHFVADHPDLNGALKARMLQRASGRAWKWAKREGGRSMLSGHFLRYVTSRLAPGAGDTATRILRTCTAFRETQSVRRPGP